MLLGYSAHSPHEARQACQEGADYVFISPVFPTRKPYDVVPLGLGAVRETADLVGGKVYALGGIDASNAAEAIRAGAAGVAVISAILSSSDPAAAARGILEAARSARRAG